MHGIRSFRNRDDQLPTPFRGGSLQSCVDSGPSGSSHWLRPGRPALVCCGTLLLGSVLHLLVVSLPLLCLRSGPDVWGHPAVVAFTLGITAMFLADSWRTRDTGVRVPTVADRQGIRCAYVMGLALLLAVWVGLAEFAVRAPSAAQWTNWLGAVLLFSGAVVRHLAIRTLGTEFVTEYTPRPGQRLVCSGVYARVRHPSETGLLLALLGAALLLGSALMLASWLIVLVPLTVLRVQLEETELRRCWGEEYCAYRQRVRRFIPSVI